MIMMIINELSNNVNNFITLYIICIDIGEKVVKNRPYKIKNYMNKINTNNQNSI